MLPSQGAERTAYGLGGQARSRAARASKPGFVCQDLGSGTQHRIKSAIVITSLQASQELKYIPAN